MTFPNFKTRGSSHYTEQQRLPSLHTLPLPSFYWLPVMSGKIKMYSNWFSNGSLVLFLNGLFSHDWKKKLKYLVRVLRLLFRNKTKTSSQQLRKFGRMWGAAWHSRIFHTVQKVRFYPANICSQYLRLQRRVHIQIPVPWYSKHIQPQSWSPVAYIFSNIFN